MKKQQQQRRGTQGKAFKRGKASGVRHPLVQWLLYSRLAHRGLWVVLVAVTVLFVLTLPQENAYACDSIAGPQDGTCPGPSDCPCPSNESAETTQSEGGEPSAQTNLPINLLRGHVLESEIDVALPGVAPGVRYAQSRSYSSGFRNASGIQPRTLLGDRWGAGLADMVLEQDGNDTDMYVDTQTKRGFKSIGPDYEAPDDLNATFVKSGSGASEVYTFTNQDNETVLVFYGFDSAVSAGNRGRLKERTTRALIADGQTGVTFSYDGQGKVTTVTTSQGWSATYTYVGGGSAIKDRIRKIEMKNGSSTVLQDVEYTYYDDVTSPSSDIGSSGDLVQVFTRRRDSAGTDWIERTTQYRYFTNSSSDGKEHQLKCVIEADAVQRILDTGDTDVETTTEIMQTADATDVDGDDLSAYYSRSFTYYTSNGSTTAADTAWQVGTENLQTKYGGAAVNEYATTYAGMAKSETVNGDCASCGGSGGGKGIRMEYHYMDLNGGPDGSADVDEVVRLVVEDTLTDSDNDGSIDDPQYRRIYGVNKNGALLRSAITASPLTTTGNDWWCSSTVMSDATSGGSKNRVTERRMASAHTDIDSDSELHDFLNPTDDSGLNDPETLNDSSGVIVSYEYNSDGRRTATLLQEGENGTAYYVSATDWGDGSNDEPDDRPVAVYRYPDKTTNRSDSSRVDTTIAYTFWDGDDTALKTVTVTLPTVDSSQNGSGVATTSTQYYDELGRLRWTQDGEGYIDYYSYHPDTGGLAYMANDIDPTSLPTSADANSTKWITSSTDGASSNKPTRSGSLPGAIEMVGYSEFDDQGRPQKIVGETPATADEDGVTHIVYEATRTLVFPRWDSSTNQPALPIQVSEDNGAGVMQKSYAVDPARTDQTSGVPTGLSSGTDQSHYVSLATYHYDAVTGQSTETRRYHDIPSSGTGTLSTNYDASIVQYDHLGRLEHLIRTVSGTAPGSSGVEQVSQVVYENAFMDRAVEIKAGVSSASHNMGTDYDTYPTLTTLAKATYDDGGVGDGHLTQSLSYHGTGANDYTGANYHLDYLGRTRGVEPIYYDSGQTAIGPFGVRDLRWDGRVTHSAVYDANPTWATVLGDDDYADTIATDRRSLGETFYDDLGRAYQSRSYTVAESDGSAGNYFKTDLFYDKNSRVVGVAPAYQAGAEYAYDGLGRNYQTRTVAKLEGETGSYYSSGAFNYQSPTPDPDFSSMTGGDDYVFTISHTEFTGNTTNGDDTGLPTRRYSVDMAPFAPNETAGNTVIGVDLTNDDDYVVTYAYTYYDDARRPIAVINHGTGTNGWEYGAEPSYAFGTVPTFTTTAVVDRESLLATVGYDATTSRRNLITRAIGTSDPLDTVATKTFHDDFGRATHVAENYTNFDPSNLSTLGGGTNDVEDRVTAFAYNGLGNTTSQTAYNGASANDQITQYLYEDSVFASRATNIIYPDSSDTTSSGTDQIELAYHVDGAMDTRTDQRGVTLTYRYNDRRQIEYTDVTSFGSSGVVDQAVQSIGYTYDELARAEKITSYDDISTGTPGIVNEVAYAFNDLGQVTDSYQDHDGAATSADPTISYTYDLGATSSVYDDGARLDYMLYPGNIETTTDRRKVGYGYMSSIQDSVYNRLNIARGIWAEDTSGYKNRIVSWSSPMGRRGYRESREMDDAGGTNYGHAPWMSASNNDGYDRFGRTAQIKYTRGTGTKLELNYGYDAGSNRLYREDARASASFSKDIDELYGYDDLSRLNGFQLGGLNGNKDAIPGADRDFAQDWELDQLGNWSAFDEDDDGDETYDLEQTRTGNDANEITAIAATTGTNWVDPTYDAAGNMTKRADPDDLGTDTSSQLITYDAWDRVVKITDNAGSPATIATYEYDGLGRRIEKTVGSDTWDYYHDGSRVVEVRLNDDANPLEQFAYDTNYIDALAIRWYDADTDGDLSDTGDGEQYYLYDESFNVIALLDDQGATIEQYRYTPYGDRVVMDNTYVVKTGGTDYGQQRGFQGLLHDEESGLIENRARLLDPLTGRFVQRDPLGYPDGMNTYAAYHVLYGGVDPWGLENKTILGIWWDELTGPGSGKHSRKYHEKQRAKALAKQQKQQQQQQSSLGNKYNQMSALMIGEDDQKTCNREAQQVEERGNALSAGYDGAEVGTKTAAKEIAMEVATGPVPSSAIRALRHADEAVDVGKGFVRAADGLAGAGGGRKLIDDISLPHNKQRQMLREALGGVPGDNKVAHHVVPLESLKEHGDLMRKAAEGGFDINGCNNGLLMDVGEDMMQHMGPHNSYNKALLDALGDIDADALSPSEAAQAVQNISDIAKEAVQNGTFPPNNSW